MESRRISPRRAKSIIARSLGNPRIESIPLANSIGRVLGEDLVAKTDFPKSDISDVDGICFNGGAIQNSADPRSSYIVESPGEAGLRLKSREYALISTGSYLPGHANVVVPVEQIRTGYQGMIIKNLPKAGQHITRKGAIFKKGDMVLLRGTLISCAARYLIATAGYRYVSVMSKPRISIVNTGDEIVSRSVRSGVSLDSTSSILGYLFEKTCCEVVETQSVGDDLNGIRDVLFEIPPSDLIVITGGTGYGEKDKVRSLIDEIKAEVKIDGIDCCPGKTLVFALANGRRYLFLPGKPSGCLILFHILILPAIAEALGCAELMPVERKAVLCQTVEREENCPMWCFGKVKGERVEVKAKRSGFDILALGSTNCLVFLGRGKKKIPRGSIVRILDLIP